MTDASEWQGRAGEAWAAEWRRTDRSFTLLTERLLAETRRFGFSQVLDIGCGAGELSLAIARGRREVAVTGLDISGPLVAIASERAAHLANVRFVHADAAKWQPAPDEKPDLLVSRHGVMFFDDPEAAFRHLAAQAAPGAGLLFSCFRERALNPFFTEPARLLPDPPEPSPPDAPGPFAFAEAGRTRRILEGAGWENVEIVPFDTAMIAGAGEDPVEDAASYFLRIGPAARPAANLQPDMRARLKERLRELTARHCHEGIVSLTAAMWIVTARRGEPR